MSTLADRIFQIRNEEKLSQAGFAQKLNLSQNFVWMVENGKREPSDRTLSDICRVFKVDEVWLRTGIGSPNIKKSRREDLNAIFSDALDGVSDKDKFLRALASVPDSAFPALVEFIRTLAAELRE